MFCPNCGNEIDEEMLFCACCGAPLKAEMMQQAVMRRKRKRPLWLYVLIGAVVLVMLAGGVVFSRIFSKGALQKREMERQFQLAERCLDRLEYRRAVTAYRAVLKIDPENREALEGLRECSLAWAEHEPESAEKILEESLAWYEEKGLTSEGQKLEKELTEFIVKRDEALKAAEEEEAGSGEEAEGAAGEEEPDDGWKAAYLELLNDIIAEYEKWNPGSEYSYRPQCVLFYLDDDEIPEFAYEGMADGSLFVLYSYADGEAVLLDNSEGTRYIPGEGLYMDHQGYGVGESESLFQWNGRENRHLWEGCSELDFDSPIEGEYVYYERKYFSDGKEVSEAQYNAALTRNFDDSRAVSLEYDKTYEEMVVLLSQ